MNFVQNLLKMYYTFSDVLRTDTKGDSVFKYSFMMSLKEKDYPKYLKDAYYIKTKEKLNLKNPKLLREKIQWLKIYDNLPIKTILTDKYLVRNWIKDKIGEEYLKPLLWVGDKVDDIPFDNLPESFHIKLNHGCKWCIAIKNKQKFLDKPQLVQFVKKQLQEWLSLNYFGFCDFEPQYKNIVPKILIEPLLNDDLHAKSKSYYAWCVNGIPYIEERQGQAFLKEAEPLSKILSSDFKFVRIDWMIYNKKLYFEEMTFTPFSGFIFENTLYNDLYKTLSENLIVK